MAYDAKDGYVLLFGGSGPSGVGGFLNDTWKFDHGAWTQIHTAVAPSARAGAAIAYDVADGYVLLFGGTQPVSTNDTWEYSGGVWTELHPAVAPPEVSRLSMAYDPETKSAILVLRIHGSSGTTWSFAAGTWTELSANVGTSLADAMTTTYDPAAKSVLFFYSQESFSGSSHMPVLSTFTFEFNGTAWVNVTPTTGSPPWVEFANLAYDSHDGYPLLYLGGEATAWKFASGAWTQISSPILPAGRQDASLAYDPQNDSVILFGGDSGCGPQANVLLRDTWAYSGGVWTMLSNDGTPPAASSPYLADDLTDGYVVLFGGCTDSGELNDTWEFRAGAWTQIHPTVSPPILQGASMAFDPKTGYVVLFGGITTNGGYSNQTWKFSAGEWTNITGPGAPTARFGGSLAYDDATGSLILFGGDRQASDIDEGYLNDTWDFAAGKWTNVTITNSPAESLYAGMAFDVHDDYLILFGAHGNETWKYASGSWTELTPAHAPPVPGPISYDAKLGAIVLFSSSSDEASTWSFSGGQWTELSPSKSPGARESPNLVYDSSDGYILLFGGYGSKGVLGDTWSFAKTTWKAID